MKLTSDQTDRACGVLLAQACGDALGVPYEFGTPPAGGELARMAGGGLGDYAPEEFSDDTQMAACIAMVSSTGVDLTSAEARDTIAEGFLRWRTEGASDIGVQTSAVLDAAGRGMGGAGARVADAAAAYATRNPRSAGNGALMRTAIVGLTRLEDTGATAAAARAVAALTHADLLAGDSAVLWSEAVRVAVVERRLDLAGGLDLIPHERRDQWAAVDRRGRDQADEHVHPQRVHGHRAAGRLGRDHPDPHPRGRATAGVLPLPAPPARPAQRRADRERH